ncbi:MULTISPECIES: phenylalanine--tRNA ligase subunit beta [unclassified Campylobacter]|uniref:phenylalanine--tRNA ligase subunit beta n=1 Tax=unclassified Campylobacter TaxID=2593542 RepID=UPI0022E9A441|nr:MULTISPECIES: phenylalanine--tRNA ligase subunit beta [unclassified Campylobacter]MDA3054576.1 phenylalanine--tRNA ligase subunit beta [Campylobacter sp. VBCF_07 NA4]MDA3060640.1 phenylalanine--tRNA ligase subunit beta [Campylobacter sp. VBCF_02 NA5]MDA3070094.1 phenylalanine--tRNA ligase subunit beta [Campylobacter sp. VBCF_08 NA3]WBR54530.1 phenylalanine--tRNA ligase subunit beta [Campylobacter sp. VBCF_01 NA2]
MIITKNWLQDWIDLSEVSSENLALTLNSIGLEVDAHTRMNIPNLVVVGLVKSKRRHENSDHLNVCEVDVGEKTLQIVCGAKNVDAGQFVAVALVGAKLPGGLEIKPAKLRGEESFGMICSSTELGLPKTFDGIMILDESIGELIPGKALNEYEIFNDDIIEIELTANRGDCLSILGIARDLSAGLNLALKEKVEFKDPENAPGIGRILNVHTNAESNARFAFRAFEARKNFGLSFKHILRLAIADLLGSCAVQNYLSYVTHATGVLLRAYDFEKIANGSEKISLDIKQLQNGEFGVYCGEKLLSIAGICQDENFKACDGTKIVIIEANYTKPLVIAKAINENKSLKGDEQVYRSSRGSEPSLGVGTDLLFRILGENPSILPYAGAQRISSAYEPVTIRFSDKEINKMIGADISRDQIVKILKKLGFDISIEADFINAKVPHFRHDVLNAHDICEEIVRIVGIDNIASAPMKFEEKTRINETYINLQNSRKVRKKAVALGFFECVHYVFDDSKILASLGFTPCKKEILNPINSELDALRPTLINHLLASSERNLKNSKKSVKLFELGTVFDAEGVQSQKLGFVASGLKNESSIANGAKPAAVDFLYFAGLIQSVIGKFSVKIPEQKIGFLSEFEQALIEQNGEIVGFIGRVDGDVEKSRDLEKTYLCEIDFEKLKFERIMANAYSKFPSISRDLSILVPNDLRFEKIKEVISSLKIDTLKEFLPTDLYRDESLKDSASLTIKFSFQDDNKTLEDDEVAGFMDKILQALNQNLGLELR